MSGKTNLAADAASRYPAFRNDLNSFDTGGYIEGLLVASINKHVHNTLAITWQQLSHETKEDPILSKILNCIENGLSFDDPLLSEYHRCKNGLYVCEGVLVYKDCGCTN